MCAALMFVIGCSKGNAPPKLADPVPMEGTVKTTDGKPIVGATVIFHPKTQTQFHGAVGFTDDTGKYVLESDVGDGKTKKGIVPGQYSVTVNRLVKPDGTTLKRDPNVPPMNVGAKEEMPMKYASVNEMGLTFDVPAAGGTFDITIDMSAPQI
ncbi:MAG: carboxypeptidase regulatory-like domain-containing protein [Planctomycetia bacterium]|nr:carboxypeptidase regulatory-like domain-containing protein [Planctomycetia bacterium]